MSIFKIKPWWSNHKIKEGSTNDGLQNFNCLKVDKFSSHSESDCILLVEGPFLKIYKPNSEDDVANVLLEMEFNSAVLQVETGKFTTGAQDRQILILHSQSYAVYDLQRTGGHTDAGEQNILASSLKHSFTRKAHSVTCGPFGKLKTRDLICVQGLDGTLSFFDQETFLFMCIFDDVIIPGPVCYVASSDTFVLCKSTWVLEVYSYDQLRDFSELNSRQNKKNIPQWAYNAGEEISSVQAIQTSNHFSSIIALGERYLYCFQDNGLMKFIKKFDFMPMCFTAYLIGWYYEPTSRLLIMVASEDAKLFIYEGTTLLWSCDLIDVPISLSRCFLRTLPGGIVTLSASGVVNVGYIGTEPDLSPAGPPIMTEIIDPAVVQTELENVEESLKKFMGNKDDIDNDEGRIDKIIMIKAEAGQPKQNTIEKFTTQGENSTRVLMCPIIVILNCEEPKLIQSVQITYVCTAPFKCIDSTICLNSVNGTEIIETNVSLTNDMDIPNPNVYLSFIITDATGRIVVITKDVLLPMSLYCVPVDSLFTGLRFEIKTNVDCVDFLELFADFSKEELTALGVTADTVSFAYPSNNKVVKMKSSTQTYSIGAEDFSEIIPILETFIYKLIEYNSRMEVKEFMFEIKCDKDQQGQLIHRFLKSIEAHAKERIKFKAFENELSVLQRQFTLVQKKLLVQYGSSPPGDCDSLEFLMRYTYERLIKCAHNIMECKESVCRAGNTMSAVGRLITFILKTSSADSTKVNLAEEMLSLGSLYEDNQDWEESVTQGLTYVLRNVFKKSDKDREKLAPVTEQGVLSHINLKRFLRQIRIILDKMFAEVFPNDKASESTGDEAKTEKQVFTRIEEFVEVL